MLYEIMSTLPHGLRFTFDLFVSGFLIVALTCVVLVLGRPPRRQKIRTTVYILDPAQASAVLCEINARAYAGQVQAGRPASCDPVSECFELGSGD